MSARACAADGRSAQGFTLLEMMLALVIFSLIAAAGSAVLLAGLRAKDRLAERQKQLSDLAVARAILKADLVQVAQRPVRRDLGGIQGFTGGLQGRSEPFLLFVRRGWINPDFQEDRASLQTVEYWLDEGVLIRRAFDRVDATQDTPRQDRVLLTGVEDFEVTFQVAGEWADQWLSGPDGRGVPALVALEFTLEGVGPLRQVFLTSEQGR